MLDAVQGDKKIRNLLISAIKKVWHRHPRRLQVLQRVRIERQEFKKDGMPRARPSIFYKCDECGALAKGQRSKSHPQIHVDHIDPVVPLTGYDNLTWDGYIKRLFCDPSNLQAICNICHDQKTANERRQRVEIRKSNKE
jgi:5-methylcytosine-specific restriction endonuclease McrA